MKNLLLRYRWLLPVIWMVVIFAFSAQPSSESAQLSGWASQIIIKAADALHISTAGVNLHYLVRKTAHFTVFAVLGLLWYFAIYRDRCPLFRTGFLAFIISAAYAASDEFHQFFVAGRSSQVTDVMIDSSGVLLAVLLSTLFVVCKRTNSGTEKKPV